MRVRLLKKTVTNQNIIGAVLLLIAVLLVRVSPVTADPISSKAPSGAFLPVKAVSLNELVYEIESNPNVLVRYAKVFHSPPFDVGVYFKKNLSVTRIKATYVSTVYCVGPKGAIYTARKTLHAGDRVFALKNGRPVLLWAYGNPLMTHLPAGVTRSQDTNSVASNQTSNGQPSPATSTAATAATSPVVDTPVEKVAPYSAVFSTPSVTGQSANFVVPLNISSSISSITPILAAIPFALFGNAHSTGSPSVSVAVAPESDTGTIWVAGALVIGIITIQAARKKKAKPAE